MVKADWKESFKKKQVGVSDMTLLSTISNESINENLKKRFESAEIYVGSFVRADSSRHSVTNRIWTDIYRSRVDICQPFPGSGYLHACYPGFIPGQEPSRGTSSRLCYRRVLVLQHEESQGESMCNHLGGKWCRQDRSCEADHAVHRCGLGRGGR